MGYLTRFDAFIAGDVSNRISYFLNPVIAHGSSCRNCDTAYRSYSPIFKAKVNDFLLMLRAYSDYKFNRYANFRFGRMFTPATTYVETYSPGSELFPNFPEYINANLFGNVIFSPVLDGISFSGSVPLWGKLSYNVFTGFHALSQAEVSNDSAPAQQYAMGYPGDMVVGGRIKFSTPRNMLEVGVSYEGGTREEPFQAVGADVTLRVGGFKLVAEYMLSSEDEVEDLFLASDIEELSQCGGANSSDQHPVLTGAGHASITTLNSGACDDRRLGGKLNVARLGAIKNSTTALGKLSSVINDFVLSRFDSHKTYWYFAPTYVLSPKWILAARYEEVNLRSPNHDNGGGKKIKSLAVNYLPSPEFRLMLAFLDFDYEKDNSIGPFDDQGTFRALQNLNVEGNKLNPDYTQFSFSAILSF